MSDTKLLSYESLRTVIFHLEPNLRILLSVQLPSTQVTEKTVPLILKNLELTSSTISIGETCYDLGLTRFDKYRDKWELVRNSDNKKVVHDVDKYGFKHPQGDATPGDLAFTPQEVSETVEEHVHTFLEMYQDIVVRKETGFWDRVRFVGNWTRLVAQFAYKKANLDNPPFMYLLHLSIHRPHNENSFHELVVYTGSLSTALKYLNTRILGGRVHPIKARNLEIHPAGCIRLPENWTIEVHHLKVKGRDTHLNVIRPILAEVPLKTITVFKLYEEDYPILRSAQKVVVYAVVEPLPQLPFQRIHFDPAKVRSERIIDIMMKLREEEHPIGTYYSFGMPSDETSKIARELKSLPEMIVREEVEVKDHWNYYRCIELPQEMIFPINHNSEISIRFVETFSSQRNNYRMDMKVQYTGLPKTVTKTLTLISVQLSDNSRKAIFGNMNPCFRLFLSQKNPVFLSLEKESPLKIEYLSITPSAVKIDWASYKFDIRPYDFDEGRYKKSYVGVTRHFDVDKYGFRVPSVVLPGDLNFGLDENQSEEKQLAALNAEYEKYELKLKEFPERQDYCEEQLEWLRGELDKYRRRRKNEEPSYKYFLYLSIDNKVYDKVERMEYHQNHHIASKYIFEKLFGGRSGTMHIKNLALRAENDLLRLSESLKMNVKHLTVQKNANGLKIFQPILANLYSLDSIGIDWIASDDIKILRGAKNIVLTREPTEQVDEQLSYLQCHSRVCCHYVNFDHIMGIVDRWQRKSPEIGTEFSFACRNHKDKEIIEKIAREPGAEIGDVSEARFDRSSLCVIFPINDESEITICIAHFWRPRLEVELNHEFQHFVRLRDCSNQLVMKVRRRGTATRH